MTCPHRSKFQKHRWKIILVAWVISIPVFWTLLLQASFTSMAVINAQQQTVISTIKAQGFQVIDMTNNSYRTPDNEYDTYNITLFMQTLKQFHPDVVWSSPASIPAVSEDAVISWQNITCKSTGFQKAVGLCDGKNIDELRLQMWAPDSGPHALLATFLIAYTIAVCIFCLYSPVLMRTGLVEDDC